MAPIASHHLQAICLAICLPAARVLAREGMSDDFLNNILARQMPDAEKRARANWVFDTGNGVEPVRKAVLALIAQLREAAPHA